MAIVIKKRVSLGFLGEDYEKAYLVIKAVPVKEYEELLPRIDEADRLETIKVMTELLKSKFVEGKFPDAAGKLADVTADDIDSFDEATLAECFLYATGQKTDPKA